MKVDDQVLRRYLEGDEKEGAKELILDWFSDLRADTDLRAKYSNYWDEPVREQDLKGYDGGSVLNRIYHEIKLRESRSPSRPKALRRFINIAAKVAAVLFIPLVTYLFISRGQIITPDSQAAFTELYSPFGARTMFYLPDGTSGWLNGGSSLEFPTQFQGKSREVVLKGEAYFDVISNPRKPFHVSGPHISVVAYGTSFNVLAYPDARISEVTLASGSVRVGGIKNGKILNSRMLEPDQMYTYDRFTLGSHVIPVNADHIIAWKEGKLIFKDDPLREVIKKLNRWYNVDMVIKNQVLESYVYMATFEDETLDEVLKLLRLSAPIRCKDLGRKRNYDGTFTKRRIELYYRPGS